MATTTTTLPEEGNLRQRYYEILHHVPKAMSELMSSYVGVPKAAQIAHITRLRDEAFAQFPYPCMGSFRFLDLDLSRHAAYQDHVLRPLSQPAVPGTPEPLFLDCGCCLGQDVRKLVADGAPPHRVWASDVEPRFIELGFELFKDRNKLPEDHFLCPGNMLADIEEDQLAVLHDRVTILHISAVFHLFDLDNQKRVASRCLRLLRKDTGAPVLVLGAHQGARAPERHSAHAVEGHRYVHGPDSWEALWRDVCGLPRWRDCVAALEVKAKTFARTRNADPAADELFTLSDPNPTSDAGLWQVFEVSVTFKLGA